MEENPGRSADDVNFNNEEGETTKRKGWINHGITCPESVADHMYRLTLMVIYLALTWKTFDAVDGKQARSVEDQCLIRLN
uniref:HD domain-containing protein n=1 Tax=Kalanchoe fedtschenkoi TaxID=63787 RepID=A0A7N1A7M6_KALFE